jgi:DNA-binding LytR/AlgR family response regulator
MGSMLYIFFYVVISPNRFVHFRIEVPNMLLDKSLQILVVEDNEGFAHLIRVLLLDTGLTNVHIVSNYEDGLEQFELLAPDICLFDIDLGKNQKNGIQLAEKIREMNAVTPIIFLTSYYTEEYYEQCKHVRPSCFMSKEISHFKLLQAIDLALLHSGTALVPTQVVQEKIPFVSHSNFFFKIGDIYKSIPVKEIAFFFADQKINYARVGLRSFPTSVQLKTLEQEFSAHFVRIHKSYLVNVSMIESIHPGENSVFINGETLPIGHAYKKPFLDQLQLLK